MRRVARHLLAALIVAGCAHKSLIQEKTEGFVGQPLSAVTAKLGAPTEEDKIGGTKLYVWAAGPESSQGECRIRVTMRGDVIGSFDWIGTESQRASYALMLQRTDCRKGVTDARIWLRPCL
jgi:hypothetical protein